ncbi:MAG TPA: alkaline phosphatase family protein, partial [Polyangiaceae bacterium]|nr:alkaline phosphatase family protein [Polyangiaceae bacterium]
MVRSSPVRALFWCALSGAALACGSSTSSTNKPPPSTGGAGGRDAGTAKKDAGVSDSAVASGGSTAKNDSGTTDSGTNTDAGATVALARQKLRHVIVIMQENRSFDSYFGTFPGAEGIPMKNGKPVTCLNDPATGMCTYPYHDTNDKNGGGPHGAAAATADINAGKMDGFIAQSEGGRKGCTDPNDPTCSSATSDVMGYHDDHEIPNYWAYAENFVLQDHLFEPNASWSLPSHLFMVSEWSALCSSSDPMSCVDNIVGPTSIAGSATADWAWTDLTYLLHQKGVSWKYYLAEGDEPDCEDDEMDCPPVAQLKNVPSIWNPLPRFDTVKADKELGNVVELD